ncbi:MAG: hypothetical protein CL912_31700 [Deltaproteobacteria bacterium]|nr:hypothetical protein [Deltaproteobacteria bacterium]
MKLTLIRDPDRGSCPRFFIKLTPKFTKQYLGAKDMYMSSFASSDANSFY